MKPDFYIGIDPGTKTGIAAYSPKLKKLTNIDTMPIHRAMQLVHAYMFTKPMVNIFVVFEDARQIKLPPAALKKMGITEEEAEARKQGAGSVKRDCSIWEDFLTDLKKEFTGRIDFRMADPRKNSLKTMPEQAWRGMTKWEGRTSEHARAAATYVWGM